jgi:vacuolar-type H+-ATPase subunit H
MLAELARSEKALEGQIADAKVEATRTLEAAKTEAEGILANARAQAKSLEAEYERKLADAVAVISNQSRSQVQSEVELLKSKADERVAQAVQIILKAVAPT